MVCFIFSKLKFCNPSVLNSGKTCSVSKGMASPQLPKGELEDDDPPSSSAFCSLYHCPNEDGMMCGRKRNETNSAQAWRCRWVVRRVLESFWSSRIEVVVVACSCRDCSFESMEEGL